MQVDAILRSKGSHVMTTSEHAMLSVAIDRMASADVGSLVVLDGQGKLLGIVTERDVMRAVADKGVVALVHSVGEVMTKQVLTCSPSDQQRDVMAVMTRKRVRHLPVLDHGALVGLISIGDLVKARVDDLETESNVLRDAYLRTR